MAGMDVQRFISSHRAKLNQEKIRIMDDRTPRGILPSGSNSTDHAATLRRERETEYQDYLKTQGPVKSRSISDIRQDMAHERDNELYSRSGTNLVRDEDRRLDYGNLKERKMAEERSYRSDRTESRRRWEDSKPSVSFKQDQYGKNGDWESEEKDLVSWARQKHSTRPPPRSPSHRTISAPTHTVGGITTLGVGDNDREAKRNRQKEYAESLREQMREKNGLYEPTLKRVPYKENSPEKIPPRTRSQPQQDPRRPPSEKEQHYPPHPSMYQHYPPPPPPPHPYYMPHSYYPPQPPRDMYYQERPDPYRYPYYPPQEYANPYLPPNVPAHVTRPRDDWAEPLKQRERETELRRSDERKENRKKYDSDTSPIHGSSTKRSKIDKNSYRRELENQMKEKKERELKTKIDKEKYELRREVEIYDPFGKGGCGAPVRDQSGHIVADLKKLRRINDERSGTTPRNSQEFANTDDSPVRRSYEDSPRSSKTVLTYGKMDDESQKRGEQESYRDYLRRQVQEKEDRKRKAKEAERLQEQKEMKRLEDDSLKLDSNLKKERARERLTEVALKQKNEEIKKEAEIRRKELIIKQRELLHKEQQQAQLLAEQKMQNLVDKMAQPVNPMLQQRSSSPPIPTVRKKLSQQGGIPQQQGEIPQQPSSQLHQIINTQPQQRSSSPPVPTIQRHQAKQTVPTPVPTAPIVQQRSETSTIPATESSILTQLAAMRMHLQAQLSDQMKTNGSSSQPAPNYTVPAPRASAGPRVRQPQNSALNANVENFSSLKYKNPHQELLSQFPNPPRTESALEVQQGAMLRYQEERLAGMRNREKKPAPIIRGQLPSFSDGVALSSADPFQEDPRPSHARDLLSGNRGQPSGIRNNSAGGQSQYSIATLDVDGMASRNEERMRRLDAILNAGTHTRSVRGHSGGVRGVGGPRGGVRGVERGEDSESIISNFLQRTGGRPSITRGSEMSLECETAYQRLGTPSN